MSERGEAKKSGEDLPAPSIRERSVSHQGVRRDPSLEESAPTIPAETPVDRISVPNVLPVKIGEVIGGKYRIERVIGQGGAGIVFAATNLDLEEQVALKFLRPDVGVLPEVVARFAREARAAVSIKSEHVCKVLDVGIMSNGAPFMVMEFLDGRDLFRVMKERGGLPVREAVEYALQVCEALALAHAKGIVHRDVKPENVFLIENEGLPIVKVLDFGISKAALTAASGAPFGSHPSLVTTNNLLGTPAYMSPEQIRASGDVDHRTDVWSLGIVLYEILAGKNAFTAASVPQMSAMILEREPPPLASVRPDVPPGLVAVIERCLRKSADQRYPTIADLARALLPFAPKRARIHVERCNKTRKRDGVVVGEDGATSDVGDDDTQAGPVPSLKEMRASAVPPVAEPPIEAAPATATKPETRTTWILIGAAAVSIAAAIAVVLSTRSPSTPGPTPSVTATATATATVTATATTAPTMSIATAPTTNASVVGTASASASTSASAKKPTLPKKPGGKDVDLGF